MRRVLFVCLGNICRSPAAEAVFASIADPGWHIDSAGTSNWHIGSAPYGPMIDAAATRGYDLTPLRARQFQPADFQTFEMIIAMDRQNLTDIEAIRPAANQTPARLLLSYGTHDTQDVPDPYFTRDFDAALDLIETASKALLTALK